ncbi:hypothetical protein CERSUDRAFT_81992 [Gelatoporia subvermispora B]|uniref:Uncharacterized protein n=1 Tax=Ceriporiopsis subvermispora (strain B) TaxID=914234 RepID=M2PRK7_CERS8|nr:hypothetical protein CERSUDRAFT_81992 [Gelatoporia subvermispora B]
MLTQYTRTEVDTNEYAPGAHLDPSAEASANQVSDICVLLGVGAADALCSGTRCGGQRDAVSPFALGPLYNARDGVELSMQLRLDKDAAVVSR